MSVSIVAPPGFAVEAAGGRVAMARLEALPFVRAALAGVGTLAGHAAASPGSRRIEGGRGTLHVVAEEGHRWIVRHDRRGGFIARWSRDVYVRRGVPRPFQELVVSEGARAAGIPTPKVVAVAIYPAGPWRYRGDVMTRLIPNAVDLAALLFGGSGDADGEAVRCAAAYAAGVVVRLAHARGLAHPDLNVANVLVRRVDAGTPEAESATVHPPEFEAWLLDLDRCRLTRGPVSRHHRESMLRRFERSWRKWEQLSGRAAAAELEAFRRGCAAPAEPALSAVPSVPGEAVGESGSSRPGGA